MADWAGGLEHTPEAKTATSSSKDFNVESRLWDYRAAGGTIWHQEREDPGLKCSRWWDLFRVTKTGGTPTHRKFSITASIKILQFYRFVWFLFWFSSLHGCTKLNKSWRPLGFCRYIPANFGSWTNFELWALTVAQPDTVSSFWCPERHLNQLKFPG